MILDRLGATPIIAVAVALLMPQGLLAQPAPGNDLSSPKATATSLYRAVDRGDEPAIRDIFHTDSDEQKRLADAYAKLLVQTKRLADAARAKYGDAADALAQGAVAAEDIARLEAAEVKHESDEVATILLPGQLKPMRFRRTGTQWRLIVTDFAGAAPDRIDAQIVMVREMTNAIGRISDGIEADHFPSVEDAESAIQDEINEVMMNALRASRSTTRPATTRAAGN